MEFENQRVLDHGYVKYTGHMGDDLETLRNARMSTDRETGVDGKADDRLRTRLWKDKHTSPFESCELAVEVQVPLFVLQQFDRHRTVLVGNSQFLPPGAETFEDYDRFRLFHSENEFSGRYSVLPDLYYSPPLPRFGGKNLLNKQGTGEAIPEHIQAKAAIVLDHATANARNAYNTLVEMGVSNEVSRFAMIYTQYTRIRLKANLKNWLDFMNLRLREDVQLEARIYARAIGRIIKELWPRHWEVFCEQTLHAVTLSRGERVELAYLADKFAHSVDKEELAKTRDELLGLLRLSYDEGVSNLVLKEPEDYLNCPLSIPDHWDPETK